MAGGVVLETLSNRKLIILGVSLLIIQIITFLIGGLIAPVPSHAIQILGTKCIDHGNVTDKWFFNRDGKCDSIATFDDDRVQADNITAAKIVFSFFIPHPKDGLELDMSRWFQYVITVLHFEVDYEEDTPHKGKKDPILTLDARLGYRDKSDGKHAWKELYRSTSEERSLHCEIEKEEEGFPLHCDLIPFFELGSCHYDYYLVNLRLPPDDVKDINMDIGRIKDVNMISIHQNGGFTKIWISLKTVFFPVLLSCIVWFWRRIVQLARPTTLMEKMLFGLGITLSALNCPMEWLTLLFDMPYMLLLSDIRQGVFYAALLCFWIIFAGEHMMDQVERNRLSLYWKHMTAVIVSCVCLFLFDMCERGVRLTNPFNSIWITDIGHNLAMAFIIIAGVSACCYFIFLCYMVFRVFRNISAKKAALPNMTKARRKYYTGLIFRFKFLMLATLLCAALTVIFFIISEIYEGRTILQEDTLNYTGAFFTGVYGMWNVYVICLLCLYAPSHKYKPVAGRDDPIVEGEDSSEAIEFSNLPSEASNLSAYLPPDSSALTALVQKDALD